MSKLVTQEQARKLAVRYDAYNEARHNHDTTGQRVWARLLDEIQQETGVVLHKHLSRHYDREPA